MSELPRYLPLMLTLALLAYPIGRIYKRLGHSPWWGLIALVPFGVVVLLWWLALKAAPAEEPAQTRWEK
jgi:hypothetical protein